MILEKQVSFPVPAHFFLTVTVRKTGIKKDPTNNNTANKLVQFNKAIHWPLSHTSASVAKKKVMANPPAIIPNIVPAKNALKSIAVIPMPKLSGVKGKKTRRRYNVVANPFSAILRSYFCKRLPIKDAAKSRPRYLPIKKLIEAPSIAPVMLKINPHIVPNSNAPSPVNNVAGRKSEIPIP